MLTNEVLKKKITESPLVVKHSKRLSLLENARKVAGAKAMSAYDKYYASQLFENLSKGRLDEGYTQSGNVSGFTRGAFDITSIAIQNTILDEIASVQAMNSVAQVLPVLELKYGTNKGGTKAGDVMIDSTGAGKTDKYYDGANVVDMPVAAGANNFLSPFTPIDKGSVVVTKADGTKITDDKNGAMSDGGSVNYATGEVKFNAALTGAKISLTYNNAIVPNYLYPELSGHNTQQVGDVLMAIRSELIMGEEHKLRAIASMTAGYNINKEYGIDMNMEFKKQVANEINKEKERLVIADMFIKAEGGNAITWSTTPRPGVSDAEHAEGLQLALNLAAAQLYTNTGGNISASAVVAGANVVAYLTKCRNFVPAEIPKNGGSFLAGKLGTLDVYQTPALGANDFFLTATGEDFWQRGTVVGDYMPITSSEPVTLGDFTTQSGYVSIYGYKVLNGKLYIRGRLTA